ncbi:hypothetical protein KC318_g1264 [Hortaea werneckii]|uniref:Carboxylic ester hydrolase n=1 Tax=Hortaea werneckii TaxID=91943 RepID=A0A3M7BIW3_HORWE|nr:hypothetical protein KC334_g14654 [Hortaea werneckii]KAI7023186.1 hypothetical protein KC355_g1811 [Hortaea werneckii]KAI7674930.1 hypothetical protein KC318_g1264 [Hortaea werneckii]RMY39711.1 hypothetical protein D0866_01750 [Hortaea werneckii]
MKHYQTLAAASAALVGIAYGQAIEPVSSNSSSDAPSVDLGYVKYQGYSNASTGINYFRGIPYAASPTGNLRWRKPVPIEWMNDFDAETLYNATEIAPACYLSQPESTYVEPGTGFTSTPQGFSENCLILDVLKPTNLTSKRLPVMVQIHGGGYTQGNAQSYPGDAMVNASNGNLIYVSIQYRLGLFGFLSGGQVAKDGSLNAGLLDQRAALDWVQRNIRAFGGDPSMVTIWGGSAGGGSVTAQMIAGGAYDQPPFSAAIAEYPWWQPFLNESQQEMQLFTTYQLSNCSTMNCLRSLPTEELAALNQQVQNVTYPGPGAGYGVYYFGPVVDGHFIQELPHVAFSRGRFYDVPLIVDREEYEGYSFSNMSLMTQTAETMDARFLFPFAGPAFFSRLYELYPRSDFNSTFYQRQTWFGDFIINCPTYYMASNAVDRNDNSTAVFKLTFAAGSQLHGSTTPFLAAPVGWPGATNQTLARIMTDYWISFAVTHDPNSGKSADAPYWPSYVANGDGTFANGESVGFSTLDVNAASIGVQEDPDASGRCEFFGNHGYQVMN